MGRRKVPTGSPLPKALACGMLEDNGRILFLKRISHGIERIELPCVLVHSGRSPVAEIKEKFTIQTGIDGEVHEIIIERRHNAGSRKRKIWVPCIVFKITAKNMGAKPSEEFSGFKWLSLENAKKQKLSRNTEWLRNYSTSLNLKP
ncbi:hypothetical protein KKB44_04475 [Candidatus Micrarchaeota archaeon]|nr:hypothetical protein [Candidatus Micrarchaeota archaeon]